jgi:hypothetical protein
MLYPLEKEIVGVKDLKEAHFFQGPHALQTEPVLKRYGRDMQGFKKAAKYLEGHPLDMADAAYRLHPFPRIPVYYLFWQGDAEFDPRISVLFDRSIEDPLLCCRDRGKKRCQVSGVSGQGSKKANRLGCYIS